MRARCTSPWCLAVQRGVKPGGGEGTRTRNRLSWPGEVAPCRYWRAPGAQVRRTASATGTGAHREGAATDGGPSSGHGGRLGLLPRHAQPMHDDAHVGSGGCKDLRQPVAGSHDDDRTSRVDEGGVVGQQACTNCSDHGVQHRLAAVRRLSSRGTDLSVGPPAEYRDVVQLRQCGCGCSGRGGPRTLREAEEEHVLRGMAHVITDHCREVQRRRRRRECGGFALRDHVSGAGGSAGTGAVTFPRCCARPAEEKDAWRKPHRRIRLTQFAPPRRRFTGAQAPGSAQGDLAARRPAARTRHGLRRPWLPGRCPGFCR
jgi:hypothetical protein